MTRYERTRVTIEAAAFGGFVTRDALGPAALVFLVVGLALTALAVVAWTERGATA